MNFFLHKYIVNLGLIVSACSILAACGGGSDSGGSSGVGLVNFTVNASAGVGGAISPSSRSVQSGQSTSFTVTPDGGYRILSVNGCNGTLNGNTYTTGIITSACSVSANFVLNSYTVTASAAAGGTINPSSREVEHGSVAEFIVSPDSGYAIADVTGCNGSLSDNVYTTGVITGSCSVTASFALKSYEVTAIAGQGGSINPDKATINHAGRASFTVTPAEGFSIADVVGCNGSLNGNIFTTGPITSACNITASFIQNSYAVTAVASEGGKVTPGSLLVLHGQTAQFSVVPDDNYRILEVTGCGGSLTDETYTTVPITSACTINGSFSFVPVGGLNDTGSDWCADATTNYLECPIAGLEGQDGEFGRDAEALAGTLMKIGSGDAGFDYTKIAADGSVLEIQDVNWDANGSEIEGSQWSCVRDNVTGLIWEIKTTDGLLRDINNTYSWYNPDNTTNGGNAGVSNGGSCSGSDCDTFAFVRAVNSKGLCGASDWRIPTRKELLSLVNNGRFFPAIDWTYFPNTQGVLFWTASPSAQKSDGAWVLNIMNGNVYSDLKSQGNKIRLVRTGL